MIQYFDKILLFTILFCFNTIEAQYLGRKEYKQFSNYDFKTKIALESESVDIGKDKMINPVRVMLLNNYLVILDKDAQKYLHVIDIHKNKYLGQYIDIGSGVNEISSARVFRKSGKDSFVISDSYNKKFFYFKIEDLLKTSIPNKIGQLDKKNLTSFLNYDEKNEKLFYTGFFKEDYRLFVKDLKSGKIEKYGELLSPEEGKLNSIEVRNHLSATKVAKHKSHIAFVYEGSPLIEVFNTKKKKLISALVPHNHLPEYFAQEGEGIIDIGYTQNSIFEFLNVELTDKYIYAVYRGQEFSNSAPKNSVVYVFDYHLDPVKMFFLDNEVSSIFIHNDETMYALKTSILIPGVKGELLKYDLTKR